MSKTKVDESLPIVTHQGVLEKVKYTSAEDDYCILIIGGKTIKGQIGERIIGGTYKVTGRVHFDPKWRNKYMVADSYELVMDSGPEGLISYLAQEGPGIGRSMAERLYAYFGADVLKAIEHNPMALAQHINGCTVERAFTMQTWIMKERAIKETKAKLYSIGLTRNQAAKVVNKYGGGSIEQIKKDCFKLVEIQGFGFVIVSKIADMAGVPREDPQRIAAAVVYSFSKFMDDGHVCVRRSEVIAEACKLLVIVHKEKVNSEIERMITEKKLATNHSKFSDYKDIEKPLEDFELNYDGRNEY